jgi:hypothetical protein
MPAMTIASARVPSWSPRFAVSDAVRAIRPWDRGMPRGSQDLTHFAKGYDTPDITFTPLGRTTVAGNSFCVRGEELGVLRESLTLIGGASWAKVVPPGEKLVEIEHDAPALVCGNLASKNYYHWTLQCFANLLVYKRIAGEEEFSAILPSLNRFQSRLMALSDFFGRTFELELDEVAAAHRGIYGNLCGGAFAFAPHPAVMAQFDALAEEVAAERSFGRRLYVSRRDASGMRGIVNEDDVCDLMLRHGFEIITPGELSVDEQIVAFREAEVIAGPHGAGLTNLVYCRTGSRTRVIELLQESYVPGFYIRICQAKGLDYTGLISPDVSPAGAAAGQTAKARNFNNVSSAVDLVRLARLLSEL